MNIKCTTRLFLVADMASAEALQTIERELPDLIILDIKMPKMVSF